MSNDDDNMTFSSLEKWKQFENMEVSLSALNFLMTISLPEQSKRNNLKEEKELQKMRKLITAALNIWT